MKKKHRILVVLMLSLLISGCTTNVVENKGMDNEAFSKLNKEASFIGLKNSNQKINYKETIKLVYDYKLSAEKFNKNFNITNDVGVDVAFESTLFFNQKEKKTYVFLVPKENKNVTVFDEKEANWGHLPRMILHSSLDFKTDRALKSDIEVTLVNEEIKNAKLEVEINESGYLTIQSNQEFNLYYFDENKFNKIDKKTKGSFVFNGNSTIKIDSIQNAFEKEVYFITMKQEERETAIVQLININDYKKNIPIKVNQVDILGIKKYATKEKLPKEIGIDYLDGSRVQNKITYINETAYTENKRSYMKYDYVIDGTNYKNYFLIPKKAEKVVHTSPNTKTKEEETKIKNVTKNEKSAVTKKPPEKTYVKKNVQFSEVSDEIVKEVKTVNRDKNILKNEVNVSVKEPSGETVEKVQKTAPVVDQAYEIDYANDFELYVAKNLIAQRGTFSIAQFDQYKNTEWVKDTIRKVIYQNPMILNVDRYTIYTNGVLKFDYKEITGEEKQKEILSEANKIIQRIMKPGMTDEQKIQAIYTYLEENTAYDYGAAENAEKNNFRSIDASFNDSFNTYGVMVKKIGVCQSYSTTFKLLAEMAGIETIVVTGDLKGVPHAWNKVKLHGRWVNIDTTNNVTNTNVPYMVYLMGDSMLASIGYTVDDDYWTDNDIGKFANVNNSDEYYQKNGFVVNSYLDYTTIMERELAKGNRTISVRYMHHNLTTDQFITLVFAATTKMGVKAENITYSIGDSYISFTLN